MAEYLLLVAALVNFVVSFVWATSALMVAKGEKLLCWPVSWRWLVVNWMTGKSLLFFLIFVEFLTDLPTLTVETVLLLFTVVHAWAFWRWLHLPRAPVLGGR